MENCRCTCPLQLKSKCQWLHFGLCPGDCIVHPDHLDHLSFSLPQTVHLKEKNNILKINSISGARQLSMCGCSYSVVTEVAKCLTVGVLSRICVWSSPGMLECQKKSKFLKFSESIYPCLRTAFALLKVSLLEQWGWPRWPPEVSSNLPCSVILNELFGCSQELIHSFKTKRRLCWIFFFMQCIHESWTSFAQRNVETKGVTRVWKCWEKFAGGSTTGMIASCRL